MEKNSNEINTVEKHHSLSAKTIRSTIMSCLVFGLVAQIVALSFYAFSLTKQYIEIADSIAHQAAISSTHGSDAVGFSKQVMEIYNSLTDEERAMVDTPEYREFFSEIDCGKGSVHDFLVNIIKNARSNNNVYDVYLGMYDKKNNAIVYIIDTETDDPSKPGDWENVTKKEIIKFTNNANTDKKLYVIDWTKKYGLLCTVGVPIRDEAGTICSYMLVDISIENIIRGMAAFSLQLTLVFLIITILLALFQTRHIQKKLVTPINKIVDASQAYVKDRQSGNTDTEHFTSLDINTKDEIENLANTMKEMESDLAEYESNLTRITAEKERIGMELSLATAIQASMLPHIFPPFPERKEFDIYAMMEPAREIGGDFYDFFLIDEDHLCLVIADVSGKGIPAALFMMISKTILQSCAMLGQSTAEILNKTNQALCTNNQVEMFVTVWLGILEISTGKLTAANAGHEYPIIKRANGEFELFKDHHSLVIGGMSNTVYKEYSIDLHAGDKIFVYTDGIPESSNDEGKMYGIDRMINALNSDKEANSEALIKNVRASVGEFVKDAEQFDDLTMLCLEYNKN